MRLKDKETGKLFINLRILPIHLTKFSIGSFTRGETLVKLTNYDQDSSRTLRNTDVSKPLLNELELKEVPPRVELKGVIKSLPYCFCEMNRSPVDKMFELMNLESVFRSFFS